MCTAPIESSLAGRLTIVIQRLAVVVALGTLAACGGSDAAPGTTQAPGDAAGGTGDGPQKPPALRCDLAPSQCGARFCTDGVCCDSATCPAGQRCDILGSQGVCSTMLENGGPCGLDTHCQSGFCVESACCAVAACPDGESCNVAGHAGECSALPTPPPPTATRTPRPTATATATPSTAALGVSSAAGAPGERVSIAVSLDDGGAVVVGLQNDLVLDGINIAIAARTNGSPDCRVEPAIHKDATGFAFVPPGCVGAACTGIRAVVLAVDNLDPIDDGSVLYRCSIDIAAGAPSRAYPITLAQVVMSDARGKAVHVAAGIDGTIIVADQ